MFTDVFLCDFQTAWGRIPRRAMDDVPSLKGLRLKWRKTGVSTSSAVDVAHQNCDNDVIVVSNEPDAGPSSADPLRASLEANSGLDLGFDAESCHGGASSLYEPSSDFLERCNDSAVCDLRPVHQRCTADNPNYALGNSADETNFWGRTHKAHVYPCLWTGVTQLCRPWAPLDLALNIRPSPQ